MEEKSLYDLDERQKRIRWQVGCQSNMILMVLVLINGFVSQRRPWAEPLVAAAVLIFLSTAYFVAATIWRDAYQVDNPATNRWMAVYLVLGLVNLFTVVSSSAAGHWQPVQNGLLTTDLTPLLLGLLFLGLPLVWWAKRAANRRREEQEEEAD